MLIYRAKPLTSSLPEPAELLEWKEIQLITANKKPDSECPQTDCERADVWWQGVSAEHYNNSARDLPPAPMQQKVYVQGDPKQNHWTPATITQTPTTTHPRSYTVDTKEGAPTKGIADSSELLGHTPPGETTGSVLPSSNIMEQPRWEVKRPETLIECM